MKTADFILNITYECEKWNILHKEINPKGLNGERLSIHTKPMHSAVILLVQFIPGILEPLQLAS
ncbi:hypothetical protein H8S90_05730 [Olivibacter sp. SDN3]|uniref:hypothetical protein n=1 Tax=Olivibacter sp. SDN3 TaxID=2764720 RepID=UPI0016516345|nr:hypothetical protein [Olivibacter sp. SDN3]QNL51085.1 hypothetical protein H8S90_05730 [Olivibacter sp. SDN3]